MLENNDLPEGESSNFTDSLYSKLLIIRNIAAADAENRNPISNDLPPPARERAPFREGVGETEFRFSAEEGQEFSAERMREARAGPTKEARSAGSAAAMRATEP